MAHFHAELEIDRPIEEVFATVVDFSRTEQWDPTVRQARRLDGPGPIAVGSEYDVRVDTPGRALRLTYAVAELRAPERVVFEAESQWLRARDAIELHKAGAGTLLVWDATLSLHGLAYLLDLPLHLAFQWSGARSLEGLRGTLLREK